jgi:two-component sensor histidine kinase
MEWMKHQSRQENMIYLVVWGMLFAAPLLSLYVRSVSDESISFDWNEVFLVWRRFAIFLFLFLIHNFLLAPLLVHKQRKLLYFSFVAAILTVFIIYQCSNRPDRGQMKHRMHPPMEQRDSRAGESNDGRPFAHDDHPSPAPRHHLPPPIIGERDILAVMMLLLMFGANLGMKYYYRSRNDHKKLLELEKQNLEQQLEYLRYQINPHFFMNTLNNIHALVDIDPEKAQATILELSKMMRFVLYEGDKNNVTLSREFDFLRTYIHLMELRYTDKVKISVDLPSEVPDKTLPPLMLISFVENAFKHGVSYRHDSFIEVSATLSSDQMHFTCRNSKADHPNEEKGGVGLSNVKKRLDLLYDNRYTLDISDGASTYNVELTLPLS